MQTIISNLDPYYHYHFNPIPIPLTTNKQIPQLQSPVVSSMNHKLHKLQYPISSHDRVSIYTVMRYTVDYDYE